MNLRSIVPLAIGAVTLLSTGIVVATNSRMELSDGSVLVGEVRGFIDGSYVVETDALGKVRIPQSRIRSIRPCVDCELETVYPDRTKDSPYQSQVEEIQQRIATDQQMVNSIMGLAKDPDVRAVLDDPELMRRILARDIDSLQGDPRLETLINNPEIRALIQALHP